MVKHPVNNRLNKEPIKAVVYGNLHMKFPEPTNKIEEQANRRVEIKIP